MMYLIINHHILIYKVLNPGNAKKPVQRLNTFIKLNQPMYMYSPQHPNEDIESKMLFFHVYDLWDLWVLQ